MLLVHYLALNGIALTARKNRVEVHEDLVLSAAGDIEMPEQLEVAGSLYMEASRVQQLPRQLRVHGHLDISNTAIAEIPADTKVRGSLYARNCRLEQPLPFFDIYGDLDLSGSSLPALQRGLRVHGSLNLYRARLQELPEDVVVDQVLYLVDSAVKRLPGNLSVGRKLVLSDSLLAQGLPADLRVAGRMVGMLADPQQSSLGRAVAAVSTLV
jgi:hypothetical protein